MSKQIPICFALFTASEKFEHLVWKIWMEKEKRRLILSFYLLPLNPCNWAKNRCSLLNVHPPLTNGVNLVIVRNAFPHWLQWQQLTYPTVVIEMRWVTQGEVMTADSSAYVGLSTNHLDHRTSTSISKLSQLFKRRYQKMLTCFSLVLCWCSIFFFFFYLLSETLSLKLLSL